MSVIHHKPSHRAKFLEDGQSFGVRWGFTLIELVVSVSILAVLLALLVTALQSARLEARRTQCLSSVRQLGLAVLQHENAHKHLPTGGWGNEWVGFRDRGFGIAQPGGWIFNILPFCEERSVRQLAPIASVPLSSDHLGTFFRTEISLLICPERGGNPLIELTPRFQFSLEGSIRFAARSDYAINGGSRRLDPIPGPQALDPTTVTSFPWPPLSQFNGISYVRSRIRHHDITDGTSNVIMIGERYSLNDPQYDDGENQPLYSGDCFDIRRTTIDLPGQDGEGIGSVQSFGSAHPSLCAYVFCDGSTKSIPYSVNPFVFAAMGGRNDGAPTSHE